MQVYMESRPLGHKDKRQVLDWKMAIREKYFTELMNLYKVTSGTAAPTVR